MKMVNCLKAFGNIIRRIIDYFYPPFRKYITIQLFRYGITGSANLVFDWLMYFLIYNFVLRQEMLNLGIITLSSHIAAMSIKIPIVLCSGFFLQKYVTFSNSNLTGKTQLLRYSTVFFTNLIINYLGLKIFVDLLDLWPTPSNMIISIITIILSYFSQKHYTFKIADDSPIQMQKK